MTLPLAPIAHIGGLIPAGVDFDGVNDLMSRAGLVGASNSQQGIISLWVRLDGGNSTTQPMIFATASDESLRFLTIQRQNTNLFEIGIPRTSDGNSAVILRTVNTYLADPVWINVLASWSTGAPLAAHLFINDVQDQNTVLLNSGQVLDYTLNTWRIGEGTIKFNGCLAELYFAPGQYLDFTVESNRRKFITVGGKPTFLGFDGSRPTGVAPLIYLHIVRGEIPSNFALNKGSGGNFTITGVLDPASTSPID